jgi:hypothetical protein
MKYRLQVDPKVIKEVRKVYHYREGEKKGSGERFMDALVDCYARSRQIRTGFRCGRAATGMRVAQAEIPRGV